MLMPNIVQGFGLELIMIAEIGYIWFRSLKGRKTATLSAYFKLCSAFFLFLLVDIPVRFSDAHLVSWESDLVFLINALFIALETLTAYEWFVYFLTVQESELLSRNGLRKILSLPFSLIIVLLALSYKTGWLFYINESGMYERGSLFFLQLLIPYLYVAASFVSAFFYYRKTKNERTFNIVLAVFFASASTSVLQVFFSGSFVLAGFCLALIILYMEMFQYELRQIEKMKSLGVANREIAMVNSKLNRAKDELEINHTRLEESLAFTNFFLDTFVSAYYVGLDDCSCQTYKRTADLEENYPIGDNYYTSLRFYVDGAVHPDDRAELLRLLSPEHLRKTLEQTPTFSYYFRDISNGEEKNYKVQVIRGADESHAAFGFIDQTAEFREQQKRLLGAIPLSPDVLSKANIGLWSFELDEGCAPRMYADEAMLGLIGLDRQIPPEDTYHAWYDNIDPGSYDLVADAVDKMISGEHAEVQYPWHHPNGDTWIVRCGGVRNFEYTKGIRIEGTHQNVTELLHYDEEQRKLEEQRREGELARAKAEASDKAKTEFLFNMSHDIRTPMNAILGYTDIAIKHGDDRARVDESLEKIKIAGEHLLNLINDVLEMSRIESGKLELSEEAMDIRKLIEGVVQMSSSLAIEKSIDFQSEIGTICNPYVYADELHANEVLINLISNAVKYTPHGGKVRFTVDQIGEASGGKAIFRFEVTDNGIGMSEEFQQHLFEAFSREKTATVSRQEGAGLGLAIVRKIIDLAGGTVRVKSRPGEGSVFTVEIPLRVMSEDAIRRFEEANRLPDLQEDYVFQGRKVLLVDDNEMNREIATDILEDSGLIVETAEDGVFAVKAIEEKGTEYYDFVLMDIQMPAMNGYEATEAVRRLPGGDRVTIVALSANAFEEDVQKSLQCGMNAHVAKPIVVRQLFETLRELVK